MKVVYLGRKSKYLKHGGCYVVDYTKDKYTYLVGLRQRFDSINFIKAGDNEPIDPYRVVKPAPKPIVKMTLGEELVKKTNGHIGTCSFGIEFNTGRRKLHTIAPCHAGLNWDRNEIGEFPTRVFNVLKGYQKGDEVSGNRKDLIAFYSYICNESPWRIAFEEPFKPEMLDSGVYLKTDVPKNILVGACIAMRQASEFPTRLATFIRLLKLKYSPNVAFAASCMSNGNSNLMSREGSGHDIIHRRMDYTQLVSFFNEDMFKTKGKPYKESPGYGYEIWASIAEGISMYGDIKDDNIKGTVFAKVLSFFKPNEIKVEKGWGGNNIINKYPEIKGADADIVLANILSKEIK